MARIKSQIITEEGERNDPYTGLESVAERVQGTGAKNGKAGQDNRKVRESAGEKDRHQEN